MKEAEDETLLAQFESRIKKTNEDSENIFYHKEQSEHSYEGEESESEQYPPAPSYSTNEIETALLTSYAKAKKYKRKAKKLYNNLSVLKEHYSKAKNKVRELEKENSMLTQRLMLFSERIDDLERTYEAYSTDYRIEEIIEENEFLRKQNRR